jgi:hypothetical protein
VLAGDLVTVARVEGRQALGPGWVGNMLQETVAELWQERAVGRLLKQARATYARGRARLVADLAAVGIPATGRSGLAVWVPVADETGVTSALLERGGAVAPGGRFRITTAQGIRIGIATLTAASPLSSPPTSPISCIGPRGVPTDRGTGPPARAAVPPPPAAGASQSPTARTVASAYWS